MKVAVVNLTRGGFSGGYRKYLGRIVPLLAAHPRVQQLCLAMPPGVEIAGGAGIETITWPLGDERRGFRVLRQRLRRLAPDVVFIPTARWLDCGPIPTVVMVRNMEPLTVPFGGNSIAEAIRNLARAYAARIACHRASRVVAVSQHVRDFLARRWKISPTRVGVVYHGADPLIPEVITTPSWALGDSQEGPFLFTAGSIRPARGLGDVIQALGSGGIGHPTPPLVIAGRADRGTEAYERRMRRLAAAQGGARVIWAGQLTAPEMAWCFRRCTAYVTTSRAEACPNTALEAMHHGCLVVSTRQAPMPEVFGEAAVYYEPGNVADLAAQLSKILATESEEPNTRREALRARALRFQWREAADRTVEELLRAIPAREPLRERKSEGSATGQHSD